MGFQDVVFLLSSKHEHAPCKILLLLQILFLCHLNFLMVI